MIEGVLGKKLGMSQVFLEDGRMVPVTALLAGPCTVTQVKTTEKDRYQAIQLGYEEVKRLNKPLRGHLKQNGLFRYLREVPASDLKDVQVGQKVSVAICQQWSSVDVVGLSKGKGFQGVVKRHGFAGGPRTHGQSDRLRAPGSIGNNTFPGRVIKGKRMAGHMGDDRVTVQALQVVRVEPDKNLLLVKGAVPGAPGGLVVILKSRKAEVKKT